MNRRIVLAIACLAFTAHGDDVPYWPGYINGNEWRGMSEQQKAAYIGGVIDGFFYSAVFDADKEAMDHLNQCVAGKTLGQMTAVVDKHMKDKPEIWDRPMSRTTMIAVGEMCRSSDASY